ncbi:MAG TPA: YitT family protein [Catalimonadaceae bacterium]|nr:YitT family protein [Catalimonadaceae bacterium]
MRKDDQLKGLWNRLFPAGYITYSTYRKAKEFRKLKANVRRFFIDLFLITVGVLSAGFGLRGFILPNKFIDGGAVGISLLLAELTPLTISPLIILVNAPFILFGFHSLGREFSLKTAFGILALAAVVAFFPYPIVTSDKLLTSVFGGFFLGLGIGMAVRGGGVIDGTEVLAIRISRYTGMTIGDIILIMNILIFSVAAYVLSSEVALYSILTYLAASKTVDFVIEGIEEYTGVTIVSPKWAEIRRMIIDNLGKGVTIFKGEKGFGSHGPAEGEIKVVYTVITRLEVTRLNREVHKIDPNAFIVMTSVKDTRGGMIKRRPLHS